MTRPPILASWMAAALVAAGGSLVAGQSPKSKPERASSAFIALLNQYRVGDAETSVETLSKWKEKTLLSDVWLPATADDTASRKAFASLLTEAGIRSNSFGQFKEGTPKILFLGGWGLEDVFEPLSYRAFQQIRELTRIAARDHDDSLRAFVRSWYVVTISYCLRFERHDARSGLWDLADHEFRDDPEMRVLLGAVGEARAGPWQPSFTFDCPWPDWYHGPHGCLLTDMLQEARWGFRGALKDDPPPAEASLRLGRVLHLVGQDVEARGHLERALQQSKAADESFVTYLAALFLGEIDEESDDLPSAILHYREAVAAKPRAHMGRLALGQALVRSGADEGWDVMREMFAGEDVEHPAADDPWTIYKAAEYYQQTDRLSAMRADARRPR